MTRFNVFGFKKCGSAVLVLVFLLVAVFANVVPVRPAAADNSYTLPPVTQLTAAAYGNGTYVVAGTAYTGTGASAVGSFVVLTATDGTNWTVTQPLPNMNIENIYQIAYGNGTFVAVGRMPGKEHDSGVVLTSGDGVHWTENSFDIEFNSIVYGAGIFVLIGYNNNYTSTDGVNWTPIPKQYAGALYEYSQLLYTGSVFADFNGTQFASSPNGAVWQTQDMGLIDWSAYAAVPTMDYPGVSVTGAVYGDGMYVAVGAYYPDPQKGSPYPIVITSPDAVKWTMTKVDDQLNGLTFGNGVFAAISSQGRTSTGLLQGGMITSSDGIIWTTRDTGTKTSYGAVFFCNDRFVALGSDGTISTSPDGVNWSNQQPASPVSPLVIPKSAVVFARFLVGQDFYYPGPGNGAKGLMDTAPYIDRSSGRVLVPLRYLANALGERIVWDAATQTVTVIGYAAPSGDSMTVSMVIGSTALDANGQTQTMDQAPVIRDGRTYLPARYVAEAFGDNVSWDAASQTVTVSREE
jgi:hypothetical protein